MWQWSRSDSAESIGVPLPVVVLPPPPRTSRRLCSANTGGDWAAALLALLGFLLVSDPDDGNNVRIERAA